MNDFYVVLSSAEEIAAVENRVLRKAAEKSGYTWGRHNCETKNNTYLCFKTVAKTVLWGFYTGGVIHKIEKNLIVSTEKALSLLENTIYKIGDWVIVDSDLREGCGIWKAQPAKLLKLKKGCHGISGILLEHADFNIQPRDYNEVRISKKNIVRKATSKEIAKHFDEVGFVKIDNPMSTHYMESKKGIIKIDGARKFGTLWEIVYDKVYSITEEHFEDITTPSKKECKEFADFVVIREYGEEHIAEYDTREDTVTFGCKSYLWKDVEGLYNHMKTLDIVNVDVMAEGKPYSINIDTIEKILNDWPEG